MATDKGRRPSASAPIGMRPAGDGGGSERGSPWLRRYGEWVVRHPRLVLSVLIATFVLVTAGAARLRIGMKLVDIAPVNHPHTRIFEKIRDIFGLEKSAVVLVRARGGDVFTRAMLGKIKRATEAMEDLPGVVPDSVLSVASSRLVRLNGRGDDLDGRPLMAEVPTDPAALRELRREVLAKPLYRNLIVSEDGATAAILVDFKETIGNSEVRAKLEEIASGIRDDEAEVVIGGAPILFAMLEEYSARVAFIFPFTLLVVALVHYEAFRTFQAVVLPVVTALMSLLTSLGIAGWLGYKLDPWNAVSPIVILAIAAGHAVQMLKRYYEEFARSGDNRQAIVDALATVGPVMLTATGIAAAGFASLITMGVPSVQAFGLLMACGVSAALVIEFTLIPAWRALLPAPRKREQHREAEASVVTRSVEVLTRGVMAAPRRVLGIAGILVVLALAGVAQITANSSIRDLFYAGTPGRDADDFINTRFAGSAPLQLLVEATAPRALEDPAVVRTIAELETLLQETPGIGKVLSYVDFLQDTHGEFHPDAADKTPGDADLISQYLLLYAMALGPRELGWLLDPPHQWALITAFSRRDDAEFTRALIDRVDAFGREHFAKLPARLHVAAGALGVQLAINETVLYEKLFNIAQVSSVIFVLSSLVFGSLTAGALILTPLLLAVLINLGVMGWSGIWLSMSTASISATAISLGADFAIYLVYRVREEVRQGLPLVDAVRKSMKSAGLAVCFVSSAIVAGHLTLLFGGFRVWVHIGTLAGLIITVSAVASLTIVPALILIVQPRFLAASKPVLVQTDAAAACS